LDIADIGASAPVSGGIGARAFTIASETCAVFATLQIFLNRVTVRDWFSC
jgi:hypothetical protein